MDLEEFGNSYNFSVVGMAVMPAVGIGHFEYGWVWSAANAAYSAATLLLGITGSRSEAQ